ncbi:glycosyltransferase family 4 protein [Halobacteriovorax sp.]|uniref:glycosyltransferase family 4 protein n=1 Tax=Halobacteriovorax sp. TaxID=2020862 RepID=UPI0035644F94
MSQNKTMLILTSSQNFSWFSMTEIIPEIEKLWEDIALKNNLNIEKINVDDSNVKELILKGMNADFILITCFNLKISWALKILRNKLEIHAPLKFYVHGMATVGLWPLAFWEWDKLWSSRDSFLVSCERDKEILQEKFKNINVELFPFSANIELKNIESDTKERRKSFYYIGRISEQKNIHTLIYTFSKHLESNKKSILTLFGKQDELGSPNMGIETIDYQSYLEELIKKLGIEKNIIFKGFVPREDIESLIPDGQKIFISTSLHSDENFGMAVLQALNLGHKAIISNWGGYADFKKYCSDQISLIDVGVGKYGPYINIRDLLDEMNSLKSERINENNTTYFTRDHISRNYKLNLFDDVEKCCDFSFANEISNIRQTFSNDIKSSKIFTSYADKAYHYFALRYSSSTKKRDYKGTMAVLPWVNINDSKVYIDDPHKGKFCLEWEWTESEDNFRELFKLGYTLSE